MNNIAKKTTLVFCKAMLCLLILCQNTLAATCSETFVLDADFHLSLRKLEIESNQIIKYKLMDPKAQKVGKFKIIEVIPSVFFLRFDNQRELTQTFLRFQEYFESPEFRGKIFSRRQYADWYRTVSDSGKFTYLSDWAGFNIPSWVLRPFYEGEFKYITARERQILEYFKKMEGEFYIIAGFKYPNIKDGHQLEQELLTVRHEIAHALYYMNPKYRENVQDILKNVPGNILNPLESWLRKSGGYHESVIKDEQHAYLTANWATLHHKNINLIPALNQVRDLVNNLSSNIISTTKKQ